jgi:hypothetical protein
MVDFKEANELTAFPKHSWFFNILSQSGIVLHTFNPSIWEAEMGGSWVAVQFELHSKTLTQTKQSR